VTHYERLGVSRAATPDELRAAYRRAARATHPDRNGDRSADDMAQVNEAWRVLGDPARRLAYDHELDALADRAAAGTSAAPRASAPRQTAPTMPYTATASATPARFPWRFMLGMAAVGTAFVTVGHLITDPGEPTRPDGLLQTGSCVMLELDAYEVACDGRQDAVVQQLIPSDQTCPTGTEPFRDRQGMGTACVVRSGLGS
jgi:hypothetical protein